MTQAVLRSISGTIGYTSNQDHRVGAERGREYFRIDVHADGSRTIAAHGEIDDAPAVVRDVNLRLDADRLPQECFVRISVGGNFRGSAWFRFSSDEAECEGFTSSEGRFHQSMPLTQPLAAFGNHAMINDAFLLALYDLSQGPGVQVWKKQLLLSSPDHRGATGPMLFAVDVAIEYVGTEELAVAVGSFLAHHFRMVDVPGLPLAYPDYDLWVTTDGDYVLLKAMVGGYMQTAYELTDYVRQER